MNVPGSKLRIAMMFLIVAACLAAAVTRPAHAQQTPIHLRVSLGDVDITKITGVVALEEGIYKKNGLEVEQYITPSAAVIAKGSGVLVPPQYVRAIDADVAIGGGTPLIVGRVTSAKSRDRIILGSLDHVVHWYIIARKGIGRVEDLKGKRLGYTGVGAMTHSIALALAGRMGWDPNQDLSLIGDAGELDTLQNGSVDAFVAPGVSLAMAKAAGITPIADLRSWNLPIAGSGLNSTASWVKKNPEATRRFVKSIVEAIALMKKDKSTAYRAMGKWFNIADPEIQGIVYQVASEMPRKPYPAVDGIKKTMELYNSHEMRQHKAEDFYDDSFVRELDQSGFIDSLYK
jgi:NitT/TauT family transport system substrate-binding protein